MLHAKMIFMFNISLLQAESAIAALNCSGAVLGSLPIRLVNEIFLIGLISCILWVVKFILSPNFMGFILHMQGKPIKDTCSAPCSSPCNALNHLFACYFLMDWSTANICIYLYRHRYSSTIEVLLVLMFIILSLCLSSVSLLLIGGNCGCLL